MGSSKASLLYILLNSGTIFVVFLGLSLVISCLFVPTEESNTHAAPSFTHIYWFRLVLKIFIFLLTEFQLSSILLLKTIHLIHLLESNFDNDQ